MFQIHSPKLTHLATAHLTQTMTLLGLTTEELGQKIDAELANNPALEIVEERRCPTCQKRLPDRGRCPVCAHPKTSDSNEPIVLFTPQSEVRNYTSRSEGEELPDDNYIVDTEELPEFIMRQIGFDLNSQDREIAAHILYSLDEDGLLRTPLMEFARYHHTPESHIRQVIESIKVAEPYGVGSSTPQEAMLAQLDILAASGHVPEYTGIAIREGLDLLGRHQYGELAKRIGCTSSQAETLAQFILNNLNPFPGRAHWGKFRTKSKQEPSAYYRSDVIISFLNDDPDSPLVVEILTPFAGTLRINPMFRNSIKDAPPDKIESWKGDMERAALLTKCIQQRNHTMQRLMHDLCSSQEDFIRLGDSHLTPITRAKIAENLQVHESTISRAVSTKTVQLPNRQIIPMAKFFDRSLPIRTALINIIQNETKPLSDTELTKKLNQFGYSIARRTVAKYRSMEGILPARLREHSRTTIAA